jgi:hypothetical protein
MTTASAAMLSPAFSSEAEEPPRLAAIVTEYRENSHADVIVTKLLEGCKTLDVDYRPRVKVVSLFRDQIPANDTGGELAEKHGVKTYNTIREALTLGGDKLAVDGVVLIAEHGMYPYNELGQHMLPRRRFFEETAAVFRASGRSVPVYNDKHLAYAWADAKWMYDASRELKAPLMAGSSIPITWRKPELKPALGTSFTEALVTGFGGTEAYGFHALEGLQCMLERRKGGETGVRSVQHVAGEEVWKAADRDLWSWDLLRAALACAPTPEVAAATPEVVKAKCKDQEAFLIEYRDGVRGAILMLHGLVADFLFAGKIAGQAKPAATHFWLQEDKPFGHFARLCQTMEPMFLTGKAPYPVERTLLTGGILDRALQSRFRKGEKLETPELAIGYKAVS